jgi:hypothetical protein
MPNMDVKSIKRSTGFEDCDIHLIINGDVLEQSAAKVCDFVLNLQFHTIYQDG